MVEHLASIPDVERLLVVTNGRFRRRLPHLGAGVPSRFAIEVVDDGTTTNETRLGAIGDIAFTLERHPELRRQPLRPRRDNLVDFRLADLCADFQARNAGASRRR